MMLDVVRNHWKSALGLALASSLLTAAVGVHWDRKTGIALSFYNVCIAPSVQAHRYEGWVLLKDESRKEFEWSYVGEEDIFPDDFSSAWRNASIANRSRQATVFDEYLRGWPLAFIRVLRNRYGESGLNGDVPPSQMTMYPRYKWGGMLYFQGAANIIIWSAFWVGLRLVQHRAIERYRIRRGLCVQCGYDVSRTGTPACPECGAPTAGN